MSESNQLVIRKLEELESRYVQIDSQISDQAVACDLAKFIPLGREQGKLRPLVTKYRDYKQLLCEVKHTEDILCGSDEQELKDLAAEELKSLTAKKDTLLEQLRDTLVMSDDAGVDSVIIEIRAGTGGEEAALFAKDLYNMYIRFADKQRWKVETLDFSASDMGGLRETIINIKGPGVWSSLGYEGGGHRVQRIPETESQGRVHTSAATVAVLPEPEEVDIQISPDDVIEHVCRAGGPGGQNVNKVSSAIRLEHIPTGITVNMREEKSQHKNRAKAWRILRTRVYEHFQQQLDRQRKDARKKMIGSGDRSERIRTYNFPQNRVTDHRINLSLYNLDKIILGDMDELVNALKEYDKQQRLKNL